MALLHLGGPAIEDSMAALYPGMNFPIFSQNELAAFELQPQQFLDRFCWFRTKQEKWAPGPGARQGFPPFKENALRLRNLGPCC